MKEIRCPHCNKVFSVDDSEYQSILKVVKDDEFHRELENREKELKEKQKLELEKNELQLKQTSDEEKAKLQQEIDELKNKISSANKDKEIALAKSREEYANQINELELKLNKVEANREMEVTKIKNQLEVQNREKELELKNQKELFDSQKKDLQEQIEHYKDLKARASTKLVGETLEQHCQIQYEMYLRQAFPNASFGKDNEISKESGSKGDFIYREVDDSGVELLSIMFEMKNENETTATKHKNEHFFKELDKDRKEKKCEYAVLVSLLESDSDLYNSGIVNVFQYEKMYVVRPQCFIPIITLLRNAALNSYKTKLELADIKNREIDVTNFENGLLTFQTSFSKSYDLAHKKFDEAIKKIDDTIKDLTKVREALVGADNNYRIANDKAQDVTIKKLTRNNPTMKKAFEDVKK